MARVREVKFKKRHLSTTSIMGSSTTNTQGTPKRKRSNEKCDEEKLTEETSIVPAELTNGVANAFDDDDNKLDKRASIPYDGRAGKKMKPPPSRGSTRQVTRLNSPERLGNGAQSRTDVGPQQAGERLEEMCGLVRTILECMGEDPDREGLRDTPLRSAKALLDLTQGYQANIEEIVNDALFNEEHLHGGMVIAKDIEIHSLCEHHLLPFAGKMHIGYVPSDRVIGLSKLSRIADMFARRLQMQERLTREVAHALMEVVEPLGVAVVMEASHCCVAMRGVQKTGTTTITRCVLGCFEASELRSEFLGLVGISRA